MYSMNNKQSENFRAAVWNEVKNMIDTAKKQKAIYNKLIQSSPIRRKLRTPGTPLSPIKRRVKNISTTSPSTIKRQSKNVVETAIKKRNLNKNKNNK